MSRPSSRHNSAPTSRRNSAHSEYDDWHDAYDSEGSLEREKEGPQEIGRLFHNTNVALCKALRKDLTDDERNEARRMTKKTTGQVAISKAIKTIATKQQLQDKLDHQFGLLVSFKQITEPMPDFDFSSSEDSKELNGICKRAKEIYEGKLTINSPNLHSFLKFLIKEQNARKLSINDVMEIMRLKLDPFDFEIFETQVETNGFHDAFDEFKELYVQQPLLTDKIKAFHQYKLDLHNLRESLRTLANKAKNAYPKLTRTEIDEKIFDYLKVNLRDPLFSKMIEEDAKREMLIKKGFNCSKLRGIELFDFLEEKARENLPNKTYVRAVGVEELDKQLSELQHRCDTLENKLDNKNFSRNSQQKPSKDFVYLNDHRYDDAVEFFNRRYPLGSKDLKTFISEWTENANRYLPNPIQIIGGHPSVFKSGGKIQSNTPTIDFPIFVFKNNQYFFSNDLLRHFAEFCFKCSLKYCNVGDNCPYKDSKDTYEICRICQKAMHSECLLN